MAEKKAKKKTGAPRKRRKLAGRSIGLTARELLATASPTAVEDLEQAIDQDGGNVLAKYRGTFRRAMAGLGRVADRPSRADSLSAQFVRYARAQT